MLAVVVAGHCILGDFGSAQKLGRARQEWTNTHWPAAMDQEDISVEHTSQAVDFFLLAVTLLDRAGVHKLGPGPTSAMLRDSASKLKSEELRKLVLELLGS